MSKRENMVSTITPVSVNNSVPTNRHTTQLTHEDQALQTTADLLFSLIPDAQLIEQIVSSVNKNAANLGACNVFVKDDSFSWGYRVFLTGRSTRRRFGRILRKIAKSLYGGEANVFKLLRKLSEKTPEGETNKGFNVWQTESDFVQQDKELRRVYKENDMLWERIEALNQQLKETKTPQSSRQPVRSASKCRNTTLVNKE